MRKVPLSLIVTATFGEEAGGAQRNIGLRLGFTSDRRSVATVVWARRAPRLQVGRLRRCPAPCLDLRVVEAAWWRHQRVNLRVHDIGVLEPQGCPPHRALSWLGAQTCVSPSLPRPSWLGARPYTQLVARSACARCVPPSAARPWSTSPAHVVMLASVVSAR